MEQVWHVTLSDGQQRGPLSADEVKQILAAGQATEQCYCWRTGFTNWMPLGKVPEFAEALALLHPGGRAAKAAGEGWEVLKHSLDKGKRGAIKALETAKLKMRLMKLNKQREELLTKLGEAVYTHRGEISLPPPLQPQIDAISRCEEEMHAVEKEMSESE